MPTKSSQYYNFTFRPSLIEYQKYHDDFIKGFKGKFGKEKYLISKEKGSGDIENHLQGFIELNKEKRADTFRNSFNKIIGNMDLSYPKVALKITPIVRDVAVCQGYILKEIQADEIEDFISGDFPTLLHKGYDVEYLLKVYKDYNELNNRKKLIIDKVRVNARNMYVVYNNYLDMNADKIKQYGYCLSKTKDVEFIIKRMIQDGYYCFDLLLNKPRFRRMAQELSLISNDDIGDGKKRII